jgi:hypothetical protein
VNRYLGGIDLCRLEIDIKSELREKGYESLVDSPTGFLG